MDKDFIKSIFKLLIANKKFPFYQAERRIDIFINLFLTNILQSYYPKSDIKYIAPEFPLKKTENNQSTKVDYLCLKKDGSEKEILFVELKTDARSFNQKQLKIYEQFDKWTDCVQGLRNIASTTEMKSSQKLKYYHLLKILFNDGLLYSKLPCPNLIGQYKDLCHSEKKTFSKNFNDFLKTIDKCNPVLSTRILYIAPEAITKNKNWDTEVDLLTFEELSKMNINTEFSKEWEFIQQNLFKHL